MRILVWLLPALLSAPVAADIPPNAQTYLPLLASEIDRGWPELSYRSALAGQIEQETCISLKHKQCWSPHAELKTSREYGFGFGQITRAYRADGSIRFDTFSEVTQLDPSLKAWKWEDRHDPTFQMRALVLKDRQLYALSKWAPNDFERLAFMLSAYNGGLGGVIVDRRLCERAEGCDAARWFGHVEHYSSKSRAKWKGYGKSAYDINREYVANILWSRRYKYIPHIGN